MPEKLTINWAEKESKHCKRSWERWLSAAGKEPFDYDGKTAFYTFQDFIDAAVNNATPKDSDDSDAFERKATLQGDILEIEKAKLKNSVLEADEIFRVLENRDLAIRRIILTCELPDATKDKVLNVLRTINIDDILAERSEPAGIVAASE